MKILIVDDEKIACSALQRLLKINGYNDTDFCTDPLSVEKIVINNPYDLIFLDLVMPKLNGLDLLKKINKYNLNTKIIILTAVNDISKAVECIKNKAYDYILKPLYEEKILAVLNKISKEISLTKNLEVFLSQKNDEKPKYFKNYICDDLYVNKIIKYSVKLAKTDYNILIEGESGTGKDFFANAIHKHSARNSKKMITVNISAIPENLFESQMFGHIKGAFTGALKNNLGFCKASDKSTLFLDEIGDLSLTCQAKLLRLIETKSFYPVGSSDLIFSDFRIIAATNKNLEIEVKEKRFREDLYFRLKTGYIYISPLRKRKEDIIKIAEDILKKINKENNDNKNFSNDFLLYLYNKKLKGNFRELSHIIKSAYLKTFDNIIKSAEGDLEFNFSENNKNNNLTLEKLKKNYIKQILKQTNNKVQTCEVLGISRSQLYKYIKKYNLYTKN